MIYAVRKDGQGWRAVNSVNDVGANETFSATVPPPPQPTQAQVISQYEWEVQKHIDAFAKTWGYDSLLSAATYTASGIPKFRNEAIELVAWRDAVWVSAAATLQAVQGGGAMPESVAAFIATLPAEPARP